MTMVLVTALPLVWALPRATAQTPLHLVSTAWPPFTSAPGDARFALDLVEEALKRIGVPADTAIIPDTQFTQALLSGPYDGSAATWRDAERERGMLFSDPYLENRLVLVGRRGSDVSATSLAGLAGKRVALVSGYSYGADVDNATDVTFIRTTSEQDSLSRLLSNETDYVLMDELVVQYIVSRYPTESRERVAFGTIPLVTRTLHLAIRRERPDAASIIARFNAELTRMVEDRTYHRLLHVDWIRTDVDGDGQLELVASSDKAGPNPPSRAYDLPFATQQRQPLPEPQPRQRFYFGGTMYDSWSAVPNRYKVLDPSRPDSERSGFTIFRFVW